MSNYTLKRKHSRRAPSPWDANVPPFTEMAQRAVKLAFGRPNGWSWLTCIPMALVIVGVWSFSASAQEEAVAAEDVQVILDNIWIVIASVLVIFMNAGFGMLETGFCRQKNAVNILTKNLIVFALATISFWALGYALAFGGDGPFIGFNWFFLAGTEEFYPDSTLTTPVFFLFQAAFAGTAATIVSGAVAERVKFSSFIIFSVLLTAICYPITAHWVWGGGWLSEIGFLGGTGFSDFAGSTVVHSVGGWAALMGAIFLGPRIGKYNNGTINAIPGHNMSIATLGCLILWIGWFGFNPGSELAADLEVPQIALVTNLAGAAGGITATFTAWALSGKPDLSMVINGILAGLVGITAGCGGIGYWGAVIVGGIAGVIVVFSVGFFDSIKIDDPVGATSVHLVCGIWGTLAVGLFDSELGLFYGGGITQLIAQIVGIIAVGLFTVAATSVLWVVIKSTVGLRVSSEEELKGLDIGEHGMEAYSGFLKDTSDMGGII